MLWIKVLHIFFVVSWFAGLFYLPRLFVNLAMVDDATTRERLLLMARKLLRFMHILSVFAIGFGVWLMVAAGFRGGWLHAKILLVVLLVGYGHYCGRLIKDFAAGRNTRSHVWFRWFNEIPTLLLLAIVVLAVIKPF